MGNQYLANLGLAVLNWSPGMLWHELFWNTNTVLIPQVRQKTQEMRTLQLTPEEKAVFLFYSQL